MTWLLLKLHQPQAYGSIDVGALAKVRLVADPQGAVAQNWWSDEKPVAVSGADGSLGDYTTFNLPEGGYYAVVITRPRGADLTAQFLVNDGDTRKETIRLSSSPHEYLGWQQYAGIVRPNPYKKESDSMAPKAGADSGAWLEDLRSMGIRTLNALYDRTEPSPTVFAANVPPALEAWQLVVSPEARQQIVLPTTMTWKLREDQEFAAWFPTMPDAQQGMQLVEWLHHPGPSALATRFPRWIAVATLTQTDLASVPWAWWGGRRQAQSNDQIRFLYDRVRPSRVDRDAPGRLTITLQDQNWTGILEFLASGKLYRTDEMVRQALSAESSQDPLFEPQNALYGKVKGPLVAVAGAIMLVTRAKDIARQEWDPWLDNLSNWFPGIPDGPIVLGCRRLNQASSTEQLQAAYVKLRDGINRGIPYFTASIRLLCDALARIANDLPEADDDRRRIAPIAARVDPEQPFTVIRLPSRPIVG
jgi:hypothetical protein